MTLMTNDLNDHHDRMVVVEVFCFMIRKSKAWHSRERQAFPNNLNPRYILSRVSRSILPKLMFPKKEN